jgi:predicted O-methyltransferase YrrM
MGKRPINENLIEQIDEYVDNLFIQPDTALEQNLKDADAAGLPAIAISPSQGRLIYILAKMTNARRILEIGTLGGYSTTFLARALPKNGELVTLEMSPAHAAVARRNLDRAGVGELVDIRVGRAGDTLNAMIEAREEPFDFVFIDADKMGYVGYLNQVLQLSHPGTVIMGDNLIRHGDVLAEVAPDEMATGVKAFNAAIASHPRLESILLPILKSKIDGMSISRVK